MKFLQEENFDNKVSVITEEVDGKEPEVFLEGIFLQANIKNRNGRIYPMEIMEPEVERYKKEYVETNRALGELGHGTGGPNIILDRVSHQIVDIWRDGDYFKAKAKLLDTPFGKIAKALVMEGIQLGVSSRALGSVIRRNGTDYVGKDFKIITAGDIVFEPSAQAAFPKGIVMEDVDWVYDETRGEYVPLHDVPLSEATHEPDTVEIPRDLAEELLASRQIKALESLLKARK